MRRRYPSPRNRCQLADECRIDANCESIDFCIDALIDSLPEQPLPPRLADDLFPDGECKTCDD